MSAELDYDSVADGFDRRYRTYDYAGIAEALLRFFGDPRPGAVLEAGCGTGHWLALAEGKAQTIAGIDPSSKMLARARQAAPHARLARARAEQLPWREAAFDRVFAINALHHFSDRLGFFKEARRLLRPGGGVLTIGLDPHAERYGHRLDRWWVYDYFEATRALDLARFPPTRTIRGEVALAGFSWSETMEVGHIEKLTPAADALSSGLLERSFTSQLTMLSDEEYQSGVKRIRRDTEERAKEGESLQLVTDLHFFATMGWI